MTGPEAEFYRMKFFIERHLIKFVHNKVTAAGHTDILGMDYRIHFDLAMEGLREDFYRMVDEGQEHLGIVLTYGPSPKPVDYGEAAFDFD